MPNTRDELGTVETVSQGTAAWDDAKRAFLDAQANQCAICLNALTFQTAQLDHCHQTGFIRGVLCISCNTRLGFYETRREAIERYISQAAHFAAYIVPTRIPRPKTRNRESLRRYWQSKEFT